MDEGWKARMEEKMDHLLDQFSRHRDNQEKQNDVFHETRDRINRMEAHAKGAWFVVGIFSAGISWLVSYLKG